jgi:MFS family permease
VSAVLPFASRPTSKRHICDSADINYHLDVSSGLTASSRRATPHHQRAIPRSLLHAILIPRTICDRLHFARAAVVVGGAHYFCPEMEPSTMAALAILVGIGFFCWLLYGAAIYTLPFIVGAFVGLRAEEAGAGALGGIVLGIGAGVLVLVLGRAAFAQARGPVLPAVIASIFAAPAALAGYSATSMIFGLAAESEDWRQAFAITGALAISTVAWRRLAATLPPASDDNQRRPAQAWGQGARHHALNPRRRPLRRWA